MVDGQIRTMDVVDYDVIRAFLEVPREPFVPQSLRELAYADRELTLPTGRVLLPPMILARLLQALDISRDGVVLDVACGTGYAAAILSRLAGSVVAVESDEETANAAEAALGKLDCDNVAVVTGPIEEGYPSEAPYDCILVEGAFERMPDALLAQLRSGGRMAAIEGKGRSGRAQIYTKVGEDVSARFIFNAAVPVLDPFAEPDAFVF